MYMLNVKKHNNIIKLSNTQYFFRLLKAQFTRNDNLKTKSNQNEKKNRFVFCILISKNI